MSYSVKISPEAREDLQDILGYYKKQKDGLNVRFFKMLVNAIRALSKAPFLFQVRYKNIRQAPIKKFPFWLHYIVDGDRELVIIIAVLHSSRNPHNWKERI